MNSDPNSLQNLRDIFIPDAPTFWPPGPGMWVLLGVVVIVLTLVGWRLQAIRKRDAYRRAGILLLSSAKTTRDVSVVMKRVALAVFPREQVASLYGAEWAAFLHKTCPSRFFLTMISTSAETEPDQELVDLASEWIRRHRISDAQTPIVAS